MDRTTEAPITEGRQQMSTAATAAGDVFLASSTLRGVFFLPESDSDDRRYLIVPKDQLDSIGRRYGSAGEEMRYADEVVSCEGLSLVPIIAGDEVVGMAEDPTGGQPEGQIQLELANPERTAPGLEVRALRSAVRWLTDVYRRDLTFDMFLKDLLRALTSFWPKCVGGVYYESDGGYRLRLASGSLAQHPALAPFLEEDTLARWLHARRESAILRDEHLDMSRLRLVAESPYAYVPLAGPRTEQGDSLIIVGLPADVSEEALMTLRSVAAAAGRLSAADFRSVADAWPAVARIAGQYYQQAPLVDVMQELLLTVRRLAPLTRLVLSTPSGPAWVVSYAGSGRTTARIDRRPPLPPSVFKAISEQRSVLSDHPPQELIRLGLADRYERDRVVRELYVPAPLPGGRTGVLAAGTDEEIVDPAALESILVTIAGFLSLYATTTGQPIDMVGGIGEEDVSADELAARNRMETLAKLAGGFFHQIRSQMFVISGHADLMRQGAGRDDASAGIANTDAIAAAVDRMSDLLTRLSHVTNLGREEANRTVSLYAWCSELPKIIHGYARYVKDTRNVALSIDICHQECGDLVLTKREAYDTIIPALLSLMDEAVCSGTIKIGLCPTSGGCGLAMDFGSNLIGHLDLAQFVAGIYAHRPIEHQKSTAGRVDLASLQLLFESLENGRCRLILQAKPPCNCETWPGQRQ